jgi:hypothetical protein
MRHSMRFSTLFRTARLRTHAGLLPAALLLALGTGTPARSQPPGTRKMVNREWVGVWKVGGGADDELFAFPREMLATSDGVYVLDIGTLQLIAFDPLGRKRWVVGSKGKGPGQFVQPVDLTVASNGDIAVLDPANGRISFFTPGGTFRRSVAAPGAVQASSLCITKDARIHLWVARPATDILTLEASGKPVVQRSFPWRVPPRSPELLRMAFFARGDASAACAFATLFGFGVGRLSATGLMTTPYIESVPPPKLVQERLQGGTMRTTLAQGVNAAAAAMHSGDTILVPFAGSSPIARRVIDLYESGGGYIESWSIPGCGRVAYREPWLYCMANMSESARLVAFVPRLDTARVLRMFPRQPGR